MSRRRWHMAAAATLLAVLVLPPVRHAMLSTMSGHMLVQLPLLIAAGWALAEGMSERWCDALNRWNAHGLTGLVWTALALALAMIPRVLDLALVDGRVEVTKWLLMLGCGVSLRLSWRPAGLLVQGFFLGNVLPMMVVAGNLYESSPVRVCNAYLLDDQVRLGQQLVWLAAVLGIVWFAVLIRRFMRDSAATALHGDT